MPNKPKHTTKNRAINKSTGVITFVVIAISSMLSVQSFGAESRLQKQSTGRVFSNNPNIGFDEMYMDPSMGPDIKNKKEPSYLLDRMVFSSSRQASVKLGYAPIHSLAFESISTYTGQVLYLDNFQLGLDFDVFGMFDISVKYLNISSSITKDGINHNFKSYATIPLYFGLKKAITFNILGIPFGIQGRIKAGAVLFGHSEVTLSQGDKVYDSGHVLSTLYPAFGVDVEIAIYKGIGIYASLDCLLTRYSAFSGTTTGDMGFGMDGRSGVSALNQDHAFPNIFIIGFGISYNIPYK